MPTLSHISAGSLLVLFFLASAPASAQSDCAAKRSAVLAAREARRDCVAKGMGCTEQFEALAAAENAAVGCPEDTFMGIIAVIVEGTRGPEYDAVVAAAHEGLAEVRLVSAGTVRAALAFLEGRDLDPPTLDVLRTDLGADRLVVLQVRANGGARFVAMRVIDSDSQSRQRFVEATAETLSSVVKRLVVDLSPSSTSMPAPAKAMSGPAITTVPAPIVAPTPPVTPRPPFRPHLDVSAFAGTKLLAARDWAPLASQAELGILTTTGGARWPVHGAADLYYSFASGRVDGSTIRTTTAEACLGVRRIFDIPVIRPHAGAGALIITVANTAAFPNGTQSASGIGAGVWIGGGALVRLGSHVNLGLQLRYSMANVQVRDADVAAGGFHAGATIGFGVGSD